jgi:single-strand DNA-binding protein
MLCAEVIPMTETDTDAQGAMNSVELCGRVSSQPLERELPSGDAILTFRISMARDATAATNRSRQSSDWVDCVVWSGRVRRTAAGWQVGDRVAVEGALRRRFYRIGAQTSTRVEVEVLRARRVERRPPG